MEDSTKNQLPYEILRHVLSNLEKRSDLKQCQLTCRQWYQASTEQLYESVMANHEKRITAFIQAVTNSSIVGRSVKKIDVGSMFYKKEKELVTWDKQDLLTHILDYCPNLVQLQAVIPEKTMWIRLMYAAINGQLEFLEELPLPEHDQIENYVYTALAFKKTLKTLVLCDARRFENPSGREINNFRAYQALLQQLRTFPNLRKLKILHHTNIALQGLDSVIQDCPRLQALDIAIYPLLDDINNQGSSNNQLIKDILDRTQPRQNIKEVSGIWDFMDNDNPVRYFMHKFPKLERIQFRFGSRPDLRPVPAYNISAQIMSQFWKYLSTIPFVQVECAFRKEGSTFVDTFVDYMKNSKYDGGIGIDYAFRTKPEIQKMLFQRHPTITSKLNATFHFEAGEYNNNELPHMELIKKAGFMIQNLNVSHMWEIQTTTGAREEDEHIYDLAHGFWLDDILENCSQLKDLAIYQPGYISLKKSTTGTPMYPSLEKLFISNLFARSSDTVISDLSKRLPSLKHLHLLYYEEETKNIVTINMQYTHFDMLIWDKSSTIHGSSGNDWKFYLKLTTHEAGETYWEGSELGLKSSSREAYTKSSKMQGVIYFDIRCNSIKVFWIKFDNFVSRKHVLNLC